MNILIYSARIQDRLKEWVSRLNRTLGYTKYSYQEGMNDDDVIWVDIVNNFTGTILAYRYDSTRSECFLQNQEKSRQELEFENPNWDEIQELLLLLTIS